MKKLLSILIAIALMLSLSVTAFAAEPYELWVGGVQVTDTNKDDLVTAINQAANATVATGSATFDEATMTLTLTDFKCTGAYYPDDASESSVIRVTQDGITIVFSGENMITGTGDCGLQADVYGNIKLEAADENSTLTFICENTRAFWHRPELVGDIDIYAGSNEDDATLLAYDVFTEAYYSYKYVRFVPAEPETETKSTTVTYQVDPTFTVTIPPTVALGETATIKAENVVVAKGKQVEVSIVDANGFKVTTPEGAELTYTVKNGETAVAEGDTILTVNPDNGKTGETTLSFVAPETIQYAGTYTGTVTFTIAVKDAPKPLISFTIDGTEYQAEEGMTLCQWAESEYDVNDEYRDTGDGSVEKPGSWGVIEDAVIVDGGEYWMVA